MKKKIVIILIIVCATAALIAAAVILYNKLSAGNEADNSVIYETSEESSNSEDQSEDSEDQISQETSSGEVKLASNFYFYDRSGNEVALTDYIGKPIVLNFWASWCGPCRQEMPYFDDAYKEYGDEIEFLIVNLTDGYQETKKTALEFVNEQGYSFPVYFDSTGQGVHEYSIYYIPDTYFIDKDGYITAYVQGSISRDTLSKCIENILP